MKLFSYRPLPLLGLAMMGVFPPLLNAGPEPSQGERVVAVDPSYFMSEALIP